MLQIQSPATSAPSALLSALDGQIRREAHIAALYAQAAAHALDSAQVNAHAAALAATLALHRPDSYHVESDPFAHSSPAPFTLAPAPGHPTTAAVGQMHMPLAGSATLHDEMAVAMALLRVPTFSG